MLHYSLDVSKYPPSSECPLRYTLPAWSHPCWHEEGAVCVLILKDVNGTASEHGQRFCFTSHESQRTAPAKGAKRTTEMRHQYRWGRSDGDTPVGTHRWDCELEQAERIHP